ncbi:MAG: chemotaxis protein CheW [Planctomycetes bacterium]|nr:chemotaxis protein CheW [Planctomycetota bacterium]
MTDICKFCTFLLDDFFFGVEVDRVQEVLRHQEMTRVPLADDFIRGLINLRGQIVTAIDPRVLLGLPARQSEELPMNVVIRTEDGAVSLLVDDIDEVVEVDDTTFEPPPENLDGRTRALIRGVHKFPDRLMLVLDVDSVLNSQTGAGRKSA